MVKAVTVITVIVPVSNAIRVTDRCTISANAFVFGTIITLQVIMRVTILTLVVLMRIAVSVDDSYAIRAEALILDAIIAF